MAATLDFNLLCLQKINLKEVFKALNVKYGIKVGQMLSINNWNWEEERTINNLHIIDNILEKKRIVVIYLKSEVFSDIGLYIEKFDQEYLYSIWINTEGYEYMDSDKVDIHNVKYYEFIYQMFAEFVKRFGIAYRVLAIGVETNFIYSKNNEEIVKKSEYITSLIFKDDQNFSGSKEIYKKRLVDGLKGVIFEKDVYE